MAKRIAIYPGTFDPVTNGHLSLIERATGLFDHLIVAVASATGKNPRFNLSQRIDMMTKALEDHDYQSSTQVISFEGLLANLAIEHDAIAIVRGLRAVSDFEYEFQMALMNRKLARSVETVFLMPALSWVYLSSTIVKDVAAHGGAVDTLVPAHVAIALKEKADSSRR